MACHPRRCSGACADAHRPPGFDRVGSAPRRTLQVPAVIQALEQCFSFEPSGRPTAVHVYDVLEDAIENL